MQDDYAPFDVILDPAKLGLTTGTAASGFGQLFFVRTSQSNPMVTLFLHGVGGTWATWTPLLQAARDAGHDLGDLLLVDLPGFGASENTLSTLDVVDVGQMLADLVSDLGWSRVRLVGHSMGGFVALDMASRSHPELDSVCLISGAYFSIIDTVQNPFRALASHRGTAVAYLSLAALAETGAVGVLALKVAERLRLMPLLLGRVVARPSGLRSSVTRYLSRAVAPQSFIKAARNGKSYDPMQQWAQISLPLRATFGSEDHLVPPADMDQLRRAAPHAECSVIQGVSHFGHIEAPAKVLELLFAGNA